MVFRDGFNEGEHMKLGWVDYSREERNKILYILRNIRNQTALDELGIGTIRDAFSNLMFPGISTLHTRAKYFVLIPYLFQKAKTDSRVESGKVRKWIEDRENDLVVTLVKNSVAGTSGIIGARKLNEGGSVKYKPSGTYWNGLRVLGIVTNNDISLDDTCQLITLKRKRSHDLSLKLETSEDAADDKDSRYDGLEVFIPLTPDYDFMNDASIDLTKEEANFLYQQIVNSPKTKDTLLSNILSKKQLPNNFENINPNDLPEEMGRLVHLAQDFANFIYGAHLLFNVIYSEGKDSNIVSLFDQWLQNYQSIDLEAVIRITHCSRQTSEFLRRFDENIKTNNLEEAKRLIIRREKLIKGDRAKLSNSSDNRYKNPIHNYKLSYRYPTVLTIVTDILKGLDQHG